DLASRHRPPTLALACPNQPQFRKAHRARLLLLLSGKKVVSRTAPPYPRVSRRSASTVSRVTQARIVVELLWREPSRLLLPNANARIAPAPAVPIRPAARPIASDRLWSDVDRRRWRRIGIAGRDADHGARSEIAKKTGRESTAFARMRRRRDRDRGCCQQENG